MSDDNAPDDEPQATPARTRERTWATTALAAAGGLGLLWWFGGRSDGGGGNVIVDDRKSRLATIDLLAANPGIYNATALRTWLVEDGFVDFDFNPPKGVGNATPLILGQGSGYKRWPHTLDALKHFSDPGGGYGLRVAVNRAIAGSPQGDDSASRTRVVAWLQTLADANDPGFGDLVADLTAGGWTAGEWVPPVAPAPPPPLIRTLAVGDRSTHILDYPRWLQRLDTRTLLDRVEHLAYPDDPSARARYVVWLNVQLAIDANLPGFVEFATYLNDAGWNDHPLDWKPPAASAVIPLLGGLPNVNVSRAFSDWTPTGIQSEINAALNAIDPDVKARHAAMIALKAITTDKWAKHYTGYDTLIAALTECGFTQHPRGANPVKGGDLRDVRVTGVIERRFVRSDAPTPWATLQDFCNEALASDVLELASTAGELARVPGPSFRKWVLFQTLLHAEVWVDVNLEPGSTYYSDLIASTAAKAISAGVLMDSDPPAPPDDSLGFTLQFDQGYEFDGPNPAVIEFTPWSGAPGVTDDTVTGVVNLGLRAINTVTKKPPAPHLQAALTAALIAGDPVIGVTHATWGDYPPG